MKVALCIPAYKVTNQIVDLLTQIDTSVYFVYVVDDCCPDGSGKVVLEHFSSNKNIKVLFHKKNKGVGGAVKTAYKEFLKDDIADIAVKLDGDGQMDPGLIPELIKPIQNHKADYVKGNRFFNISNLTDMPKMRLFGNSILSLLNKLVNGYWHIMDPTNGFTAIHKSALSLLSINKVDNRYFFESDMLFRLGIINAKVLDMPMVALYANEESNLKISQVMLDFPPKYMNRFFKRIFYCYFLRDFNAGTLQLMFGILFFLFGLVYGGYNWWVSISQNEEASSGTIMLAALPTILGFQLLLGFLNYDVQSSQQSTINNR